LPVGRCEDDPLWQAVPGAMYAETSVFANSLTTLPLMSMSFIVGGFHNVNVSAGWNSTSSTLQNV